MATQTLNNVERFFEVEGALKATLDAFDEANIRTTFKQASDPIYLAFRYVDNKPLSRLAKEFVKDSANDILSYISNLFA